MVTGGAFHLDVNWSVFHIVIGEVGPGEEKFRQPEYTDKGRRPLSNRGKRHIRIEGVVQRGMERLIFSGWRERTSSTLLFVSAM